MPVNDYCQCPEGASLQSSLASQWIAFNPVLLESQSRLPSEFVITSTKRGLIVTSPACQTSLSHSHAFSNVVDFQSCGMFLQIFSLLWTFSINDLSKSSCCLALLFLHIFVFSAKLGFRLLLLNHFK